MATPSSMTRKAIKPFSVRQRVNRKILRLSLVISTVAVFFTLIVWIASVYQPLHRWKQANLRALSEINCTGIVCDTSAFLADSQSDGANYIVDLQTGSFIQVPAPSVEDPGRFAPLDYSDTGFIARFHQPATYNTPDGEVWRLFSRQANLEGKSLEIIVGSAEKASWRTVDTLPSQIDLVDTTLKLEVDRIAASLPSHGAQPRSVRGTLSADGFEIVDANTKQVLEWGPWLPAFLPKQTVVPRAGRQLYIYDGDLYLVETETAGRLLATSLIAVGGLSWIGVLF